MPRELDLSIRRLGLKQDKKARRTGRRAASTGAKDQSKEQPGMASLLRIRPNGERRRGTGFQIPAGARPSPSLGCRGFTTRSGNRRVGDSRDQERHLVGRADKKSQERSNRPTDSPNNHESTRRGQTGEGKWLRGGRCARRADPSERRGRAAAGERERNREILGRSLFVRPKRRGGVGGKMGE